MYDLFGDPGWIRTSDLQLRRLLLYPLSYGAVRDIFRYGMGITGKSLQHQFPVLAHHRLPPALAGFAAHELEAGFFVDMARRFQHAVGP